MDNQNQQPSNQKQAQGPVGTLAQPRGMSPIIKNLMPGLTERGKIKIGKKGETRQKQGGGTWQLPVKLDHFLVTTLERGADGNFIVDVEIMKMLAAIDNQGEKVKKIPVFLLFDDIGLNFQSRYACYNGRKLWCSGDGEGALRVCGEHGERQMVDCPCGREKPEYTGKDKCKINGTLSVVIQGANGVGGVWKFRTTGYNSTVGIISSLSLIRSLTGGYLAGIPLTMTVQPKVATNPTDGSATTIQVVGIIFAGNMDDLRKKTMQIVHDGAEFRTRIAHMEEETRKLICADAELIDQAADIQDEYYPEDAEIVPPAGMESKPAEAASVQAAPVSSPAAAPAASPAASPKAQHPATRGRKPKDAQAPVIQPEQAPAAQAAPVSAPAAQPAPAAVPAPTATATTAPAPQMQVPAGGMKIDLF